MTGKAITLTKCDDCGSFQVRFFSNGKDDKKRCESCAVIHYEKQPFSGIKILKRSTFLQFPMA